MKGDLNDVQPKQVKKSACVICDGTLVVQRKDLTASQVKELCKIHGNLYKPES